MNGVNGWSQGWIVEGQPHLSQIQGLRLVENP